MNTNFPPLKNDLLLRAARRQPVDRIPVWLMRQAGRYLPEYREFTKDKEFFDTCRSPEAACEVTLQPVRRYDLDAAIIFSDILVIPQALGIPVEMHKGTGPHFPRPIATLEDSKFYVDQLCQKYACEKNQLKSKAKDIVQSLSYVYEAINLTRHKLEGKVPLLGFAGAPWTLLGYMIEGGSSKLFAKSKRWLYENEEESKFWLELMTECIVEYLICQIDAGAQGVQLFESNAAECAYDVFHEICVPAMNYIGRKVKEARPEVPIIAFAKGVPHSPSLFGGVFDVVSIGYAQSLAEARKDADAAGCAIQGNFDPAALMMPLPKLRAAAHGMVNAARTEPSTRPVGYICNLGHGLTPDIDPAHVGAFIDAIHEV